ncbi:hypothetical protein SEVIR_9G254900v4 [Setaria viridis]|uniref:Protein TIFY n=1 Tax=Setaria viridis TaxID=4556 RepID=A0A4U6T1W2_SETVI|nr:protein TIFY 11f-like [Setaria viridis]TKV93832.1 hypothetical protein SEVIR_9G254900v2 [Setaria viridis]
MAAAGCSGRRRFAVACGVLSRCVRAEAAAGKMVAAESHARAGSASTMLLMPGADVALDVVGEGAAEATPAPTRARLTIMHGGRVLVFDDVTADRAAELVRVAAGQQVILGGSRTTDDVPVARKASLRRFMEKRRDRIATRSPYAAAAAFPTAAENGKEGEADTAGCCLELGIPGGSAC